MDLKLRGRNALITGASKGIGRAIATVLADEGCNLILMSRTAADLDAARERTGEPDPCHARSSSATVSTCGVCGNMSTGFARRSSYP